MGTRRALPSEVWVGEVGVKAELLVVVVDGFFFLQGRALCSHGPHCDHLFDSYLWPDSLFFFKFAARCIKNTYFQCLSEPSTHQVKICVVFAEQQ